MVQIGPHNFPEEKGKKGDKMENWQLWLETMEGKKEKHISNTKQIVKESESKRKENIQCTVLHC